ncbi:hypothetical protein GMRT_10340 [Giardia muris]|uniref:Uncharacterized protein n=1 Tax=Giardia muris TaxID=5742 RepID=A0A4Z1T208_GIAMU|nr:hypothetical protein GMRT_10340 [Giardia muris]|eukprot:TNJ26441.1 hypothetical protein GMRT_10340 [Giardia muris]
MNTDTSNPSPSLASSPTLLLDRLRRGMALVMDQDRGQTSDSLISFLETCLACVSAGQDTYGALCEGLDVASTALHGYICCLGLDDGASLRALNLFGTIFVTLCSCFTHAFEAHDETYLAAARPHVIPLFRSFVVICFVLPHTIDHHADAIGGIFRVLLHPDVKALGPSGIDFYLTFTEVSRFLICPDFTTIGALSISRGVLLKRTKAMVGRQLALVIGGLQFNLDLVTEGQRAAVMLLHSLSAQVPALTSTACTQSTFYLLLTAAWANNLVVALCSKLRTSDLACVSLLATLCNAHRTFPVVTLPAIARLFEACVTSNLHSRLLEDLADPILEYVTATSDLVNQLRRQCVGNSGVRDCINYILQYIAPMAVSLARLLQMGGAIPSISLLRLDISLIQLVSLLAGGSHGELKELPGVPFQDYTRLVFSGLIHYLCSCLMYPATTRRVIELRGLGEAFRAALFAARHLTFSSYTYYSNLLSHFFLVLFEHITPLPSRALEINDTPYTLSSVALEVELNKSLCGAFLADLFASPGSFFREIVVFCAQCQSRQPPLIRDEYFLSVITIVGQAFTRAFFEDLFTTLSTRCCRTNLAVYFFDLLLVSERARQPPEYGPQPTSSEVATGIICRKLRLDEGGGQFYIATLYAEYMGPLVRCLGLPSLISFATTVLYNLLLAGEVVYVCQDLPRQLWVLRIPKKFVRPQTIEGVHLLAPQVIHVLSELFKYELNDFLMSMNPLQYRRQPAVPLYLGPREAMDIMSLLILTSYAMLSTSTIHPALLRTFSMRLIDFIRYYIMAYASLGAAIAVFEGHYLQVLADLPTLVLSSLPPINAVLQSSSFMKESEPFQFSPLVLDEGFVGNLRQAITKDLLCVWGINGFEPCLPSATRDALGGFEKNLSFDGMGDFNVLEYVIYGYSSFPFCGPDARNVAVISFIKLAPYGLLSTNLILRSYVLRILASEPPVAEPFIVRRHRNGLSSIYSSDFTIINYRINTYISVIQNAEFTFRVAVRNALSDHMLIQAVMEDAVTYILAIVERLLQQGVQHAEDMDLASNLIVTVANQDRRHSGRHRTRPLRGNQGMLLYPLTLDQNSIPRPEDAFYMGSSSFSTNSVDFLQHQLHFYSHTSLTFGLFYEPPTTAMELFNLLRRNWMPAQYVDAYSCDKHLLSPMAFSELALTIKGLLGVYGADLLARFTANLATVYHEPPVHPARVEVFSLYDPLNSGVDPERLVHIVDQARLDQLPHVRLEVDLRRAVHYYALFFARQPWLGQAIRQNDERLELIGHVVKLLYYVWEQHGITFYPRPPVLSDTVFAAQYVDLLRALHSWDTLAVSGRPPDQLQALGALLYVTQHCLLHDEKAFHARQRQSVDLQLLHVIPYILLSAVGAGKHSILQAYLDMLLGQCEYLPHPISWNVRLRMLHSLVYAFSVQAPGSVPGSTIYQNIESCDVALEASTKNVVEEEMLEGGKHPRGALLLLALYILRYLAHHLTRDGNTSFGIMMACQVLRLLLDMASTKPQHVHNSLQLALAVAFATLSQSLIAAFDSFSRTINTSPTSFAIVTQVISQLGRYVDCIVPAFVFYLRGPPTTECSPFASALYACFGKEINKVFWLVGKLSTTGHPVGLAVYRASVDLLHKLSGSLKAENALDVRAALRGPEKFLTLALYADALFLLSQAGLLTGLREQSFSECHDRLTDILRTLSSLQTHCTLRRFTFAQEGIFTDPNGGGHGARPLSLLLQLVRGDHYDLLIYGPRKLEPTECVSLLQLCLGVHHEAVLLVIHLIRGVDTLLGQNEEALSPELTAFLDEYQKEVFKALIQGFLAFADESRYVRYFLRYGYDLHAVQATITTVLGKYLVENPIATRFLESFDIREKQVAYVPVIGITLTSLELYLLYKALRTISLLFANILTDDVIQKQADLVPKIVSPLFAYYRSRTYPTPLFYQAAEVILRVFPSCASPEFVESILTPEHLQVLDTMYLPEHLEEYIGNTFFPQAYILQGSKRLNVVDFVRTSPGVCRSFFAASARVLNKAFNRLLYQCMRHRILPMNGDIFRTCENVYRQVTHFSLSTPVFISTLTLQTIHPFAGRKETPQGLLAVLLGALFTDTLPDLSQELSVLLSETLCSVLGGEVNPPVWSALAPVAAMKAELCFENPALITSSQTYRLLCTLVYMVAAVTKERAEPLFRRFLELSEQVWGSYRADISTDVLSNITQLITLYSTDDQVQCLELSQYLSVASVELLAQSLIRHHNGEVHSDLLINLVLPVVENLVSRHSFQLVAVFNNRLLLRNLRGVEAILAFQESLSGYDYNLLGRHVDDFVRLLGLRVSEACDYQLLLAGLLMLLEESYIDLETPFVMLLLGHPDPEAERFYEKAGELSLLFPSDSSQLIAQIRDITGHIGSLTDQIASFLGWSFSEEGMLLFWDVSHRALNILAEIGVSLRFKGLSSYLATLNTLITVFILIVGSLPYHRRADLSFVQHVVLFLEDLLAVLRSYSPVGAYLDTDFLFFAHGVGEVTTSVLFFVIGCSSLKDWHLAPKDREKTRMHRFLTSLRGTLLVEGYVRQLVTLCLSLLGTLAIRVFTPRALCLEQDTDRLCTTVDSTMAILLIALLDLIRTVPPPPSGLQTLGVVPLRCLDRGHKSTDRIMRLVYELANANEPAHSNATTKLPVSHERLAYLVERYYNLLVGGLAGEKYSSERFSALFSRHPEWTLHFGDSSRGPPHQPTGLTLTGPHVLHTLLSMGLQTPFFTTYSRTILKIIDALNLDALDHYQQHISALERLSLAHRIASRCISARDVSRLEIHTALQAALQQITSDAWTVLVQLLCGLHTLHVRVILFATEILRATTSSARHTRVWDEFFTGICMFYDLQPRKSAGDDGDLGRYLQELQGGLERAIFASYCYTLALHATIKALYAGSDGGCSPYVVPLLQFGVCILLVVFDIPLGTVLGSLNSAVTYNAYYMALRRTLRLIIDLLDLSCELFKRDIMHANIPPPRLAWNLRPAYEHVKQFLDEQKVVLAQAGEIDAFIGLPLVRLTGCLQISLPELPDMQERQIHVGHLNDSGLKAVLVPISEFSVPTVDLRYLSLDIHMTALKSVLEFLQPYSGALTHSSDILASLIVYINTLNGYILTTRFQIATYPAFEMKFGVLVRTVVTLLKRHFRASGGILEMLGPRSLDVLDSYIIDMSAIFHELLSLWRGETHLPGDVLEMMTDILSCLSDICYLQGDALAESYARSSLLRLRYDDKYKIYLPPTVLGMVQRVNPTPGVVSVTAGSSVIAPYVGIGDLPAYGQLLRNKGIGVTTGCTLLPTFFFHRSFLMHHKVGEIHGSTGEELLDKLLVSILRFTQHADRFSRRNSLATFLTIFLYLSARPLDTYNDAVCKIAMLKAAFAVSSDFVYETVEHLLLSYTGHDAAARELWGSSTASETIGISQLNRSYSHPPEVIRRYMRGADISHLFKYYVICVKSIRMSSDTVLQRNSLYAFFLRLIAESSSIPLDTQMLLVVTDSLSRYVSQQPHTQFGGLLRFILESSSDVSFTPTHASPYLPGIGAGLPPLSPMNGTRHDPSILWTIYEILTNQWRTGPVPNIEEPRASDVQGKTMYDLIGASIQELRQLYAFIEKNGAFTQSLGPPEGWMEIENERLPFDPRRVHEAINIHFPKVREENYPILREDILNPGMLVDQIRGIFASLLAITTLLTARLFHAPIFDEVFDLLYQSLRPLVAEDAVLAQKIQKSYSDWTQTMTKLSNAEIQDLTAQYEQALGVYEKQNQDYKEKLPNATIEESEALRKAYEDLWTARNALFLYHNANGTRDLFLRSIPQLANKCRTIRALYLHWTKFVTPEGTRIHTLWTQGDEARGIPPLERINDCAQRLAHIGINAFKQLCIEIDTPQAGSGPAGRNIHADCSFRIRSRALGAALAWETWIKRVAFVTIDLLRIPELQLGWTAPIHPHDEQGSNYMVLRGSRWRLARINVFSGGRRGASSNYIIRPTFTVGMSGTALGMVYKRIFERISSRELYATIFLQHCNQPNEAAAVALANSLSISNDVPNPNASLGQLDLQEELFLFNRDVLRVAFPGFSDTFLTRCFVYWGTLYDHVTPDYNASAKDIHANSSGRDIFNCLHTEQRLEHFMTNRVVLGMFLTMHNVHTLSNIIRRRPLEALFRQGFMRTYQDAILKFREKLHLLFASVKKPPTLLHGDADAAGSGGLLQYYSSILSLSGSEASPSTDVPLVGMPIPNPMAATLCHNLYPGSADELFGLQLPDTVLVESVRILCNETLEAHVRAKERDSSQQPDPFWENDVHATHIYHQSIESYVLFGLFFAEETLETLLKLAILKRTIVHQHSSEVGGSGSGLNTCIDITPYSILVLVHASSYLPTGFMPGSHNTLLATSDSEAYGRAFGTYVGFCSNSLKAQSALLRHALAALPTSWPDPRPISVTESLESVFSCDGMLTCMSSTTLIYYLQFALASPLDNAVLIRRLIFATRDAFLAERVLQGGNDPLILNQFADLCAIYSCFQTCLIHIRNFLMHFRDNYACGSKFQKCYRVNILDPLRILFTTFRTRVIDLVRCDGRALATWAACRLLAINVFARAFSPPYRYVDQRIPMTEALERLAQTLWIDLKRFLSVARRQTVLALSEQALICGMPAAARLLQKREEDIQPASETVFLSPLDADSFRIFRLQAASLISSGLLVDYTRDSGSNSTRELGLFAHELVQRIMGCRFGEVISRFPLLSLEISVLDATILLHCEALSLPGPRPTPNLVTHLETHHNVNISLTPSEKTSYYRFAYDLPRFWSVAAVMATERMNVVLLQPQQEAQSLYTHFFEFIRSACNTLIDTLHSAVLDGLEAEYEAIYTFLNFNAFLRQAQRGGEQPATVPAPSARPPRQEAPRENGPRVLSKMRNSLVEAHFLEARDKAAQVVLTQLLNYLICPPSQLCAPACTSGILVGDMAQYTPSFQTGTVIDIACAQLLARGIGYVSPHHILHNFYYIAISLCRPSQHFSGYLCAVLTVLLLTVYSTHRFQYRNIMRDVALHLPSYEPSPKYFLELLAIIGIDISSLQDDLTWSMTPNKESTHLHHEAKLAASQLSLVHIVGVLMGAQHCELRHCSTKVDLLKGLSSKLQLQPRLDRLCSTETTDPSLSEPLLVWLGILYPREPLVPQVQSLREHQRPFITLAKRLQGVETQAERYRIVEAELPGLATHANDCYSQLKTMDVEPATLMRGRLNLSCGFILVLLACIAYPGRSPLEQRAHALQCEFSSTRIGPFPWLRTMAAGLINAIQNESPICTRQSCALLQEFAKFARRISELGWLRVRDTLLALAEQLQDATAHAGKLPDAERSAYLRTAPFLQPLRHLIQDLDGTIARFNVSDPQATPPVAKLPGTTAIMESFGAPDALAQISPRYADGQYYYSDTFIYAESALQLGMIGEDYLRGAIAASDLAFGHVLATNGVRPAATGSTALLSHAMRGMYPRAAHVSPVHESPKILWISGLPVLKITFLENQAGGPRSCDYLVYTLPIRADMLRLLAYFVPYAVPLRFSLYRDALNKLSDVVRCLPRASTFYEQSLSVSRHMHVLRLPEATKLAYLGDLTTSSLGYEYQKISAFRHAVCQTVAQRLVMHELISGNEVLTDDLMFDLRTGEAITFLPYAPISYSRERSMMLHNVALGRVNKKIGEGIRPRVALGPATIGFLTLQNVLSILPLSIARIVRQLLLDTRVRYPEIVAQFPHSSLSTKNANKHISAAWHNTLLQQAVLHDLLGGAADLQRATIVARAFEVSLAMSRFDTHTPPAYDDNLRLANFEKRHGGEASDMLSATTLQQPALELVGWMADVAVDTPCPPLTTIITGR